MTFATEHGESRPAKHFQRNELGLALELGLGLGPSKEKEHALLFFSSLLLKNTERPKKNTRPTTTKGKRTDQ